MTKKPIQVEDSLAYSVYRLARLLRTHFQALAESKGSNLTQEQWVVLNKLSRREPLSQTELGDEVFADKPNITRMLVGLQDRRYITRKTDDCDARKVQVRLTPSGRAAHDLFTELVAVEREALFDGVSADDLATTRAVLARMESNITRRR